MTLYQDRNGNKIVFIGQTGYIIKDAHQLHEVEKLLNSAQKDISNISYYYSEIEKLLSENEVITKKFHGFSLLNLMHAQCL